MLRCFFVCGVFCITSFPVPVSWVGFREVCCGFCGSVSGRPVRVVVGFCSGRCGFLHPDGCRGRRVNGLPEVGSSVSLSVI